MYGTLNLSDFSGPNIDTRDAFQNALDALPQEGGTLIVPPGNYTLLESTLTVNDVAVNQGDSQIAFEDSVPSVVINRRRNITIMAHGARFTCKRSGFVFYRCLNCRFEGGSFDYDNNYIGKESFSVMMIRSVRCRIVGISAHGFHRNVVSYRNTGGGIFDCHSSTANYFGFYASSVCDVNLDHFPENLIRAGDTTRQKIMNCVAVGGKTNYFADHCICKGNESYDIPYDETRNDGTPVAIAHFHTQYGVVDFIDNFAKQNGNLNPRKYPIGIVVSNTGGSPELHSIRIQGNRLLGCVKGIAVSGCKDFIIEGNIVKDYWQTGIHVFSPNSGSNGSVRNGRISGNIVGDIHPVSSKTNTSGAKRAALQVEKNFAPVSNIIIAQNICSMGDANGYQIMVDWVSNCWVRDNIYDGNGKVEVNLAGDDNFSSVSQRYLEILDTTSPTPVDDRHCGKLIYAVNAEIKLPARRGGQNFEFCSNSKGKGDVIFHRGDFNAQQKGNVFVLPDGSIARNSFRVSPPFNLKIMSTGNLGGWIVVGTYAGLSDRI